MASILPTTLTLCGIRSHIWRGRKKTYLLIYLFIFCISGAIFLHLKFDNSFFGNFTSHVRRMIRFGIQFETTQFKSNETAKNQNGVNQIVSNQFAGDNTTANGSAICLFPILKPWDSSIAKYFKKHAPIHCKGISSLVYHQGGYLKINFTKVQKVLEKGSQFKECIYFVLKMKSGNDFESEIVYTSKTFNDSIRLRAGDSDIMVKCADGNETVISQSYLSIFMPDEKLEKHRKEQLKKHNVTSKPKEILNVIFIALDGMSRGNVVRTMPKTRTFLMNTMKALEFRKNHIVGPSTIHNVMAILTGRHFSYFEGQSKEYGKWSGRKNTFDQLLSAFLWTDYEKAGYRTCYAWEQRVTTAFHYQKRGWSNRYVDYTNRPTVVASVDDRRVRSKGGHCIGDISEIEFHSDYIIDFATTFNKSMETPYFGYVFFNNITHDDANKGTAVDHIFERVFKKFHHKNLLHNTVLVFFSDHGQRFGGLRSSYVGLVENRSPFLYMVFPEWFYKKYPKIKKALKTNQERLTTPFDVYATIKHLLYFKDEHEDTTSKYTKYGISLFQEIPSERNCSDAGIPLEKCICLPFSSTDVKPETAHKLGFELKKHILTLIKHLSSKCEPLHLKSVKSVLEINSNAQNGTSLYQVNIETTPGDAIFEGTLSLTSNSSARVVGEVTRLNMYRGQAECIDDPTLRQFCYCYKKKKT